MSISILYIEDSDFQRDVITVLLQSHGFKVCACASGKVGLKLLRDEKPDIILCDLNMPGMSGLEVLEQVRKVDTTTPFIILTAHGSIADAVKAIRQGAYDFIRKPLDMNEIDTILQEIVTTIQKALEKSALEKELQRSETNLQLILKNAPDIIFTVDTNFKITAINPSVQSVLNHSPEAMLGQSFFELIHPGDQAILREHIDSSLKDWTAETDTIELRFLTHNNSVKYVEVKQQLVFEENKFLGIQGIARDVTDRKMLEITLLKYSEDLEKQVKERTRKLEKSSQQLARLNDVSNLFTQIFDEDELLDKVPNLLADIFNFDRVGLFLERDQDFFPRSYFYHKNHDYHPPTLNFDLAEDCQMPAQFRLCYDQGQTIFIPDTANDPVWADYDHSLVSRSKSMILCPIKVKNKSIGFLLAGIYDPDRQLDDPDVARFEMYANIVGLALDNIRAYQSLEKKVIERTQSLRKANRELNIKAKELEKTTISLGQANVQLLKIQEELKEKNARMEQLLNELSERKNELETILDASPEGVVLVNKRGCIKSISRGVENLFQIQREHFQGRQFDEFIEKVAQLFASPEDFRQLTRRLIAQPDQASEIGFNAAEFFSRALMTKAPHNRAIIQFAVPVTDAHDGPPGLVWAYSDITMLKKTDEQLRAIVMVSPVPYLISRESDGKVLYVNEPMAQLVGLTADRIISQHTPDFYYDPTERNLMLEILRRDGAIRNFEFRIKRADGTPRWMLLSIVRTDLSSESVLISALYDINERKQAEDELARRFQYEAGLAACSQSLLREQRQSTEPVVDALAHLREAADACRAYLFENFTDAQNILRMRLRYSANSPEIGPTDPEQAVIIAYQPTFRRWQELLPAGDAIGGPIHFFPEIEQTALLANQSKSLLILPVFVDNAWYGFIGFDDTKLERNWSEEDIRTLRTAAEMIGIYIARQRFAEALSQSEKRFRGIVENANDIIYSLTPDGQFSYISPNWTDILGHSVAEIKDKRFVDLIHPDDIDECRCFFDRLPQMTESRRGVDYRIQHQDGTWRWHVTHASPLRDDDGQVINYIGVSHDITEIKQVMNELATANQHLRETQSQLVQSEKMAALGTLVAGIAHEINTPLAAIKSMHDTLLLGINKMNKIMPPEFIDHPKNQKIIAIINDANIVIDNAIERVTNIVRRLRSFARLDEAELKEADINEGIEDTLVIVHHELKHRITVHKNFAELPPIACYPGRLNQVFLNLIVNAAQAMPEKGKLTITTKQDNHRVYIAFADTGVGIEPKHLSRVFDPGFTTKGVGVGTGLGLSICYQIIQDHRGEITVESQVGKGTTFTIIIPDNLDEIIENT